MNIRISLQDSASPTVRALQADLTNRTGLNRAMGNEVLAGIRDHVINLISSSHKTSQALGASPSNFVGKAAQSIPKLPADVRNDGFTIPLAHPWFARAFGDVDIFPGPGKKMLTIPLLAAAYNQRAYHQANLFILRLNGKVFLAEAKASRVKFGRKKKDGSRNVKSTSSASGLALWYLLVPSVHQRQDRGRLPSDAQLIEAAMFGAELYFEQRLRGEQATRNN